MRNNQQMLDRAGMREKRREGAPPSFPPKWGDTSATPSRAGISPSCVKAAKSALQREADERQRAKDYQAALIYSESDYRDRPDWQAKSLPPASIAPKTVATPERKTVAQNIANSIKRKAAQTKRQAIQARVEKLRRGPNAVGSQIEHPHFTLIRLI